MKNTIVQRLLDLISIDSVSPDTTEYNIAVYITDLLNKWKVGYKIFEPASGRLNIIAEIPGNSDRTIVFNGHMDTKPAYSGWDTDPWKPEISEGKIYGLGAADMKGGLASILTGLEYFVKSGRKPENNLQFQFLADEEMNSEFGAQYLVNNNILDPCDFAIVAEPSSMVLIERALGNLWLNLTIYGKKAHAGHYHKGVNANRILGYFIHEMEELTRLRRYTQDPDYQAFPNFNIGGIVGEGHPGTVTEICEMSFEVRFKQFTESQFYLEACHRILKKLQETFTFHYRLENYGAGGIPPTNIYDFPESSTAPYIDRVMSCLNGHGLVSKGAWYGGADSGYLSSCNDTPSVILGPGSLDQAHQPNEYIEIDQLTKAAPVFFELMCAF